MRPTTLGACLVPLLACAPAPSPTTAPQPEPPPPAASPTPTPPSTQQPPRNRVEEIVAAYDTTCVRSTEGVVACFGANPYGGGGYSATPTRLDIPPSAQIVVGHDYFCSIDRSDRTVRCAGSNFFDVLGTPGIKRKRTDALPVTGLGPATKLVAGVATVCALVQGELWCWGHSEAPRRIELPLSDERLSIRGHRPSAVCSADPIRCAGLHRRNKGIEPFDKRRETAGEFWAALPDPMDINESHALRVYPWQVRPSDGEHLSGCIADEGIITCNPEASWDRKRFELAGTDPRLGVAHVCALDAQRRLVCAGSNRSGQLGGSGPGHSLEPILALADPVHSHAAGGFHTCAVTETDETLCWGLSAQGQTGLPPIEDTEPKKIASGVQSLFFAGDRTCIQTERGVQCSAFVERGPCGTSGFSPVLVPHATGGFELYGDLCLSTPDGLRCFDAAGEHGQRWATRPGGPGQAHAQVMFEHCWIDSGRVDCVNKEDEDEPKPSPLARSFASIRNAKSMTVADPYLCVLDGRGAVHCASEDEPKLRRVVSGGAKQIVGTVSGLLVRKAGGSLHWSESGEFRRSRKLEAPRMKDVGADDVSYCGVTTKGELVCGDTSYDETDEPWRPEAAALSSMAMGSAHGCVLDDDQTLWCWGSRKNAELGDGARICALEPEPITAAVHEALGITPEPETTTP